MSARKSTEPTSVTSYRISDNDKNVIVAKHGSLSNFLNECVAKEVKRLSKNKKSIKTKDISRS